MYQMFTEGMRKAIIRYFEGVECDDAETMEGCREIVESLINILDEE